MRIGVIGCGTIARRSHLPGFAAAGVEFTAFTSRSRSSAEAAAAQAGQGEVVEHWQDVLARDDVDAVTICSPNRFHAEQAIAAAAAGKHVLVEKPLATSLGDADRMLAAARRHGVVLMTAHNARFAPPFVAIRDALRRGELGEITAVRASLGHAGPAAWAPEADWFLDVERAGGGVLMDLGVHVADTLRWLLDDEIASVSAMTDARPGRLDHVAQVLLRTRGGVVGGFHVSWATQPGPDQGLHVFGTAGTATVAAATAPTLARMDGTIEVLEAGSADSPFAAFVRAVESGATQAPSGDDGRAALAVVSAAYTAAAQGREITVEPPLEAS